jgi:DNA polymerase-3 subunit epsilon
MKAVCVDFETANSFMGSICSVGVAIIEDGSIVDTRHWLVRPHANYYYFDTFNVSIHGINEQDVENEQEFDIIYEQIKPLLNEAVIVAHNAEFDVNALRQALNLYNIEYPKLDYICTYEVALKTWRRLKNYKLNTICQFLKHDFTHHNAQQDAEACGKVLLAAIAEKGVSSIKELATVVGVDFGKIG